jgi:hypothetical protein
MFLELATRAIVSLVTFFEKTFQPTLLQNLNLICLSLRTVRKRTQGEVHRKGVKD